ncbi:hypothetical protein [Actinoplanes sp. RD1]|uniref:hypothetical protein n=1 Tax=Actinoplanes sp. RD1 TaxID=3064538 RepID=UPI00274219AF|nr:hypothetical protein [Actinoplanes sp. RD1]
MPTIRITQTTLVTPEQFAAAITHFGPGRSKMFDNTSDEFLQVHAIGATSADVTEGNKGGWERLHYDWSNPRRITMTTTDSNLWGGASSHVYELTPQSDGTTRLDATIVREGKNFGGRLAGLLVGTVGKGVFAKSLRNLVQEVEVQAGVRG